MFRKIVPLVVGVSSLFVFAAVASPAFAEEAWWHMGSSTRPSYLPPGRSGVIVVSATNIGNARANPATQPIVITDTLPASLEAVGIEADADETLFSNRNTFGSVNPLECVKETLTCTFLGNNGPLKTVLPYYQITERILVKPKKGAPAAKSGEQNEASITGGGAPPSSVSRPIVVSSEPMPFAMNTYEMRPEEEGGGVATQAGEHPFQLTTTIGLNENAEERPVALPKDFHFKVPAGLVGNPTGIAKCPLGTFLSGAEIDGHVQENGCSSETVLGVAKVLLDVKIGAGHIVAPFIGALYNIEPEEGEPARFGFDIHGVTVLLDTSVRTGEDYGVTVDATNISQAVEFVGSEVTFWGTPGSSSHDDQRNDQCLGEVEEGIASCHPLEAQNPPPFLVLPTTCSENPSSHEGEPLRTSGEFDLWDEPEPRAFTAFPSSEPSGLPALDGCNRLQFSPSISASPDVQEASRPSGLEVDVHVPQEVNDNANGLASSNVKDIEVTLPAGVALNPSAADGLQACSEGQIGFTGAFTEYEPGTLTPRFTPDLPGSTAARATGNEEPLQPGVNFCPNASKIAEATITTPLLPNPVKGYVYLASPQNFHGFPQENPFGSLVAMYIVAEDPISGSLVKLPGTVALCQSAGEVVDGRTCEVAGQINSTFEDNPQLPFEDAVLHFFGGERPPLATPSHCGTYTTRATFTPWSGTPPVQASSTFEITNGPNDSPCPGAGVGGLPFTPALESGTTNNNAGAFSPLTTTLTRPAGDQQIRSVQLHYPPGVSGLLSGVELCPEPQAGQGTCGPNSQIGETIVSVGLGGDPFTVTGGRVYITGPYHGAPFGLSIVNPAKAGPFDLQQGAPVVVRAKIEVDPSTAALTITTNGFAANNGAEPNEIPNIIEGFPLQIQHVNVLVNRRGFTFNPTNCDPGQITGAIDSDEGASSPVAVLFQPTNCAALRFSPKFSVSTSGKTSKALGASLTAKVTEPAGSLGAQANITKVKVELPEQLPSRLTTLQKACTAAQFEANPAGCPTPSVIGYAKVITQLVPVPLEGPVYFVSHGGEAFPSLEIVLQGYGVKVILVGATFISKAGITSTTFKTVPDQPFNSFEITLPEGPYSALAANGNLCAETTTKTVSKKETVKVKGRKKTVTRNVKEAVAATLQMPNEFIAQNGATIKQATTIAVTGCPKVVKVKQKKKKKTTKKKQGKGAGNKGHK